MWERIARAPWAPTVSRLTLLLILLQLGLDALLKDRFLLYNSYQLIQAWAYQASGQPWYALYGVQYLAGQRAFGDWAPAVATLPAILVPLAWAAALLALLRWRARRRG